MAKIIESDVKSQTVSPNYSFWKNILIGALSGVSFWLLAIVINKYVFEAFICHSTSNVLMCLDSVAISGNIATIFVVAIGIIVMLKFRMVQPFIVAVATGAVIWGLASWTIGLSMNEIIFWDLITYILAYLLFSWIVRYARILPVLIIMFVIIFTVRVVTNL